MEPTPQLNDAVQVIGQQPQPPAKQGRKKIVFLILILCVLLIAGAFTYFLLKPAPLSPPQLQPSPTPMFTLDLISPASDEIAVNNEILVSGTTLPNTTVVIYTESDESSVESDTIGKFESTIVLQPGINTLTVTAFSEAGDEKSVTRDVVFDSE